MSAFQERRVGRDGSPVHREPPPPASSRSRPRGKMPAAFARRARQFPPEFVSADGPGNGYPGGPYV